MPAASGRREARGWGGWCYPQGQNLPDHASMPSNLIGLYGDLNIYNCFSYHFSVFKYQFLFLFVADP